MNLKNEGYRHQTEYRVVVVIIQILSIVLQRGINLIRYYLQIDRPYYENVKPIEILYPKFNNKIVFLHQEPVYLKGDLKKLCLNQN